MKTTRDITDAGTLVRLPDGTLAMAYPQPYAPGFYLTAQDLGGGERRDYNWRREQLQVVA